jgi:hypothetical protein
MSQRIRLYVLTVASASLLAVAPVGAAYATGGCALPNYPTSSCTGAPAGTTFTNTVNGDYTVTTAGQVIDSWHIEGALVIKTTGVVIKNSLIDDAVVNDDFASSSFTITDTTVGTATCETGGFPSIDGHDFAATRVLLQGHQDGVDVTGDNVSVTDSFMQPCYLPPSIVGGDGYHSDGVQDPCAEVCTGLQLTHNTIDARAFYAGEPTGNSALNLGSVADGEQLRQVTLNDNMLLGGGFTTALTWDAGAAWTVSGNVWVSGSWEFGPIDAEGTCSHQTWSGNSIVTANASYQVTGTVSTAGCVD